MNLNGRKQDTVWPSSSFKFEMSWGAQQKLSFRESSGLEFETQVLEYRRSTKNYSTVKKRGVSKVGSVTFERGMLRTGTSTRGSE
jgi:hypothetical protein